MSKKKIAEEVMEALGVSQAWVTTDNQAFTNEHSAINHQKEVLGKRTLLDDELPEAFSKEEKAATKPTTAEEVIAAIQAAETVEAVEELAKGDKRKTVIEAAAARTEALMLS